MDENPQEEQINQEAPEEKTPEVGFPMAAPKPKSKINKLVIFALVLLVLVGGGIFLFSRSSKDKTEEISPTPAVEGLTSPTATPTPSATPTTIDKSKISIEIQNGTGIPGEAAYLETQLKSLGYKDFKVGNAEDQTETITTVTFAKSLASTVVDEITKKLEEVYKDVETKTSSTQKVSVLIVTGLKKGATPKPTTTSTPTPTKTPTASPTATPSI